MTEIERYSPGEVARPADTVLPGTAERIRRGVPKNTRRAYERAWTDFADWCAQNGRDPLPASAATLADFVSNLCDKGQAPATIKSRMGAIAKHHRVAGFPKGVPDTEGANTVLRGYRQDWADGGNRVKEAPPITLPILTLMSERCDKNTLAGKRDRLLLVLGMALAGRRSELAKLRMEDVSVDGDGDLVVRVRRSKTDQNAEGRTEILPPGIHEHTNPVGLYLDWIAALQERGADTTTGFLFRAITKDDRLFRHNGLTDQAINQIVQGAARRAGLTNAHRYSAHSLRAGFATQCAIDGIPVAFAAEAGGWEKTSPTVQKYMRIVDKKRNNPRRKMGF